MSLAGSLLYYTYYKPVSWLKNVKKFGGLKNVLQIKNARLEMAAASEKLFFPGQEDDSAEVYFLTGEKYWPLTAFCMYSLAKVSNLHIRPVFVDDGSFNNTLISKAKKQFPGCRIKTAAEINAQVKEYLPADKYPHLNKKREIYPHIKKLTDIHAGLTGWKMVLDSDMLFFKEPMEMEGWLKNPSEPFFLLDNVTSYHYSFKLMEQLTGRPVTEKLNVGAVGLKSEVIDWDKIEQWIPALEQAEGSSYLLEQALSAMIVAGQKFTVADNNTYIVMPGKAEVQKPTAILHHYVSSSKEWYYKYAWLNILKNDNRKSSI